MAEPRSKPTIVLVHGLWMTPLCWEEWIPYLESKGYSVLAPGWPGVEGRTVAEIRADPKPMASGTIEKIVAHYEDVIKALPAKPIVMGHSFGGLFTQILVDRGFAAAGVGISPAQPAGIFSLPFSTVKATLPVLSNPFDYKSTVKITPDQFHYCFGNHLTPEQARPLYDRYAIPSVAHVLWQGALAATSHSPKNAAFVDFARHPRAPLLLIAGTNDHVVARETVVKEYERYQEAYQTDGVEIKVFEGRTHGIVNQEGWQEVVDYALDFVEKNLRQSAAAPQE